MKKQAFHLMLKPAGALCNLACDYCFFSHKTDMLQSKRVMSQEVLERLIKSYIDSQKDEVVVFTWQGGEPTLAGLDFYKRVVELQHKYCPKGKHVENDLQTNGTLLNDEWFRFLQENRFLVGLSIDGPPHLHNKCRKTHAGHGTAEKVLETAAALREYGINFNTLTAVNRYNSEHPLEVYHYLRDVIQSQHIQFLPVVETREFESTAPGYWNWNEMTAADEWEHMVTPWSVRPMPYGKFLTEIFREWYTYDRGKCFIYLFESLLGVWVGYASSLCVMAEECGKAMALDTNGALYSCDRFCYPEYRLGNIMKSSLESMAGSPKQQIFGKLKRALPPMCQACEFLFACHGGCPKNRFALTPEREPGLNYLCEGWRYFLRAVSPELDTMATELKAVLEQQKM